MENWLDFIFTVSGTGDNSIERPHEQISWCGVEGHVGNPIEHTHTLHTHTRTHTLHAYAKHSLSSLIQYVLGRSWQHVFGMAIVVFEEYCTSAMLGDKDNALGMMLETFEDSPGAGVTFGEGDFLTRREEKKRALTTRLKQGDCNSWDVIFMAVVMYMEYDASSFLTTNGAKRHIAIKFYYPGSGTPFYTPSLQRGQPPGPTLTLRDSSSIIHPDLGCTGEDPSSTITVRLLHTHGTAKGEADGNPPGHFNLVWPGDHEIPKEVDQFAHVTDDPALNMMSMTKGGRLTVFDNRIFHSTHKSATCARCSTVNTYTTDMALLAPPSTCTSCKSTIQPGCWVLGAPSDTKTFRVEAITNDNRCWARGIAKVFEAQQVPVPDKVDHFAYCYFPSEFRLVGYAPNPSLNNRLSEAGSAKASSWTARLAANPTLWMSTWDMNKCLERVLEAAPHKFAFVDTQGAQFSANTHEPVHGLAAKVNEARKQHRSVLALVNTTRDIDGKHWTTFLLRPQDVSDEKHDPGERCIEVWNPKNATTRRIPSTIEQQASCLRTVLPMAAGSTVQIPAQTEQDDGYTCGDRAVAYVWAVGQKYSAETMGRMHFTQHEQLREWTNSIMTGCKFGQPPFEDRPSATKRLVGNRVAALQSTTTGIFMANSSPQNAILVHDGPYTEVQQFADHLPTRNGKPTRNDMAPALAPSQAVRTSPRKSVRDSSMRQQNAADLKSMHSTFNANTRSTRRTRSSNNEG